MLSRSSEELRLLEGIASKLRSVYDLLYDHMADCEPRYGRYGRIPCLACDALDDLYDPLVELEEYVENLKAPEDGRSS